MTEQERKEALDTDTKFTKKHLNKEQKKISKIEQEMKERYNNCIEAERRNRELVDSLVEDISKKSRQLDVFKTIQTLEKKIQISRLEEQRKYLRQQEAKEKELQQEYYRLTHK